MLEDLFSVDRMKSEGLFNVAYLRTLMNEHFDGRRDNRKQLWTLLMFEQCGTVFAIMRLLVLNYEYPPIGGAPETQRIFSAGNGPRAATPLTL